MNFTVEKINEYAISQFNEDLFLWFEQTQLKERLTDKYQENEKRRGRKWEEGEKEDSDQIKT